MNHNKKRFVKNSIIIPLIIAVAAAGVFFVVLNIFSDEFPFTSDMVYASDFDNGEVIVPDNKILTDASVSKSDIAVPVDNMLVGSLDAKGKSLELIYNANAVNAVGRFNILPDSKLAGEVGAVFVQCCKSDADFIYQLNKGDTVKVNTYYSNFVYEVINIQICSSVSEAKKLGAGVGRALVLCTDGNNGVGMSDSMLAVVCEMTSGPKVTE